MKELDVNVPTHCTHTFTGKLDQVSTADVLPVTNSMLSSDQMSTNVSISMIATMPLIDAVTMPPVEIPLVATHVNATRVSLVMDSNVLILMNAIITHVMILKLNQQHWFIQLRM